MTAAAMIESERDMLSRTLRTLTEQFDGAALSERLNDFGFDELLAEAPREAVSALFGGLGRAGSMCTALQAVLRQPLAGVLSERIADVDVALPWIGSDLVGDGDDDTLAIRGLVIGHTAGAACLAPVAIRGELVWVHLADDATLNSRTVEGLDPELAMTEIRGVTAPADVVVAGGSATAVWAAVCTAGRLALGYQILGAVDQMIDLAVEHARSRVQFGRPIGSFQAVRNRLADAHVARQGAASALESAWGVDDAFLAGLLAKSLAGRAARIAATQCQQVLAGIGFTAEHPFHRFMARALVLDSVLGSAAELPREIGAHLNSVGTIPRLVDL
ncbi:MAG TPA: acyl-CoA dehydrogenase family protein [Mycobacterium sp.]|nr:acyl-CoA dehydrogenase family protein [Mycobacterium sp.]